MKWTCRSTLPAFLLCFVVAAMAQSQKKFMTDPLFGISYDRETIHFGRVPSRLTKSCQRLRGMYVDAWAYGHLQTADAEYFLISGLMESHADEPGGARSIAPDEGGGVVVALRGSECLVDQVDYFLSQDINPAKRATPVLVSASVLKAILQDAFKKYVVAFGGKQEFLKRVKRNAALPVVQEQLATFEKNPDK